MGRHPAITCECMTDDVDGTWASKPKHSRGHLLRLARSSDRNARRSLESAVGEHSMDYRTKGLEGRIRKYL